MAAENNLESLISATSVLLLRQPDVSGFEIVKHKDDPHTATVRVSFLDDKTYQCDVSEMKGNLIMDINIFAKFLWDSMVYAHKQGEKEK